MNKRILIYWFITFVFANVLLGQNDCLVEHFKSANFMSIIEDTSNQNIRNYFDYKSGYYPKIVREYTDRPNEYMVLNSADLDYSRVKAEAFGIIHKKIMECEQLAKEIDKQIDICTENELNKQLITFINLKVELVFLQCELIRFQRWMTNYKPLDILKIHTLESDKKVIIKVITLEECEEWKSKEIFNFIINLTVDNLIYNE